MEAANSMGHLAKCRARKGYVEWLVSYAAVHGIGRAVAAYPSWRSATLFLRGHGDRQGRYKKSIMAAVEARTWLLQESQRALDTA